MCGWPCGAQSCRRLASRGWRLPLHAGSRGLVFQTGSPFRARIRGLKTPAIERPSCGRGCIGMQPHAGFVYQSKEAMARIRTVSR